MLSNLLTLIHLIRIASIGILLLFLLFAFSCSTPDHENNVAQEEIKILGNPGYRAISFGGYRHLSRDTVPSVSELKEDLRILEACGIKIMRTYQTQEFGETRNLLKAIRELKIEDASFEMYIMLGAWIQCEGAWTDSANHEVGDVSVNQAEIQAGLEFIAEYPDIIKVFAIGNESMVHWAPYHVHPRIILQEVKKLQLMKEKGELPADLLITSSDNFASWGGESPNYHKKELDSLVEAVDYVSIHLYPFHDTHYNPAFWLFHQKNSTSTLDSIDLAMDLALQSTQSQFDSAYSYCSTIDSSIQFHIGETGWSTMDNHYYSSSGSWAADEYKQAAYHQRMRSWTDQNQMSCFFFEGFDEPWKDTTSPQRSENHFGLFTVDGQAKYLLWDLVDQGRFEGLSRDSNPIRKTYDGDLDLLHQNILGYTATTH